MSTKFKEVSGDSVQGAMDVTCAITDVREPRSVQAFLLPYIIGFNLGILPQSFADPDLFPKNCTT